MARAKNAKKLLEISETINPMVSVAAFLTGSEVRAEVSQNQKNKDTVAAFYNTAFNDHDPKGAMKRFVGDKYIQHNPYVGDGKEPFIDFFLAFQKSHPKARVEIKRLIAEGDLVVVHVLSKIDEKDRGRAVMDIFRLANGKIVEHWDVGQPIPEKVANPNTMF